MAYQPINKPIPKYFNGEKVFGEKRDCEDFAPFFLDRRYCRLSNKCPKEGYYYDEEMYSEQCGLINLMEKCTGIDEEKWQKIIS